MSATATSLRTADRPLLIANWKMNGNGRLADEVCDHLVRGSVGQSAEIVVCPPATLIERMAARLEGTPILVGGQDCHEAGGGPFTGGISAVQLLDAGAKFVLLGHSERRRAGENDAAIGRKAASASDASLVPVVCVGEELAARVSGDHEKVVADQLHRSLPTGIAGDALVVAYEPVWAIGSGAAAKFSEIAAMHRVVRATLAEIVGRTSIDVRIVYGGSVTSANAATILELADVDGCLIGGASLHPIEFTAIARIAGDADHSRKGIK